MKALIFAAGKGVRMRPLTDDLPKPLIEIAGQALLQRILSVLPEVITEVGIVIGYRGDMIRERFGDNWQDKKITYIEQEEQLGTWHALIAGRSYVEGEDRFLVMNSDDLYAREDLERLVAEKSALLVYEVEDPRRFGVIVTDASNMIIDIEEGPEHPKSNLVNTGSYVLGSAIFNYQPPLSSRGEYLITEGIHNYIRDYPTRAVQATFWLPIGYPEDIAKAEEALRRSGSK